jgi:hypothetical protein
MESFLAAILDRPDPDRTTAFVAQILGEHNFNPNEPRNRRGEWTTDGPGDGRTGVDYSSRSHRAGPSRGGIAYQDGRVVGSGDSRPYYPSPREREAIQKYDKTITVFVGHSADVIKAAKAAAVEINNTRGVRSAKIAGIGCGGGSPDINFNLRSIDGVKELVPGEKQLQKLPTGVGRAAGYAGVGRVGALPEIGPGFLRDGDKEAIYKKSLQGPPEVSQGEAISRAFVNSLVGEAIKMLPRCDGYARIRFDQLPEGWNSAFTVKDLAKEAGIKNGARENVFGHKIVWTYDGNDLVGEVY